MRFIFNVIPTEQFKLGYFFNKTARCCALKFDLCKLIYRERSGLGFIYLDVLPFKK